MSAAFILCNLDKVNMSVAVIPMANQFGWTSSDRGLVSSFFFWGYAVTQFPGGFLAKKLGGEKVLYWGVLLWSFGTLLAPWAAHQGMSALCLSRLLVGLGEGVAPAAAIGVLAAKVPVEERSRATTAVFGGLDVGSLTGLLIAPPIILGLGGWESVFYLFGFLGFAWGAWWFFKVLKPTSDAKMAAPATEAAAAGEQTDYKKMLTYKPMQAIMVTHFVWNAFYYGFLAWLPSFLEGALGLSMAKSSLLSILPYASTVAMTLFVGQAADGLLASGKYTLTQVRHLAQSVAFLGPGTCLFLMGGLLRLVPAGGGAAPGYVVAGVVTLLSAAFALGAWSRVGLFCTHQDMSPKYASVLLGITNTAAAIGSLLGTYVIGVLLDATGQNWTLALIAPILALQVLATAIFVAGFRSDPVDFTKPVDLPSPGPGGNGVKVLAIEVNPPGDDGEKSDKELIDEVKKAAKATQDAAEAAKKSLEEAVAERPVIFGMNLPADRQKQFLILAAGALTCSLGFAALQQSVFEIEGFKYPGFMTLLTSAAYAVCGFLEMGLTSGGKFTRHGTWKNYWILSTMTFGGMFFTNFALKFLNYATRIVFKSAKVVPVMLFATIVNKKVFSPLEYFSAATLCAGVALFTLGDAAGGALNFNPIGVVLITLALCVDALTSNFEERVFFRVPKPASQAEVLGYASLLGCFWSAIQNVAQGEIWPAMAHAAEHPRVVPSIIAFSVLGYVSVTFVLSIIKFFGATEAEIVKTLRKVGSIILSFVLFPKPLNWQYVGGFIVVCASIYLTTKAKELKRKVKTA
jgi:drug/metabolite transporter (DMT)-like permease/MFS family permease